MFTDSDLGVQPRPIDVFMWTGMRMLIFAGSGIPDTPVGIAFISGLSRTNDPWGALVDYFRDLTNVGIAAVTAVPIPGPASSRLRSG